MKTLTLSHVGVSFGRKEVLRGVDCSLQAGELVSIIGQNGCGKTTLLKAVAGILPYTGTICADDETPGLSPETVSYVPQLASVTSSLTVFEMVLLGLVRTLPWHIDAQTFERVDRTLHRMHIDSLADVPVRRLSGGQKQLVFMAQAFVREPKVLLLDEPTSALDLRHQLIVMNAARRYTDASRAVTLVVVHDLLTAARFSDRILLLDEGRVRVFDKPETVLDPDILSSVYRVDVSVENTRPGFLNVIPLKAL
ncbi:MAG: ABC transporter ATP-binding protein [Duodenibacillus sp.]